MNVKRFFGFSYVARNTAKHTKKYGVRDLKNLFEQS